MTLPHMFQEYKALGCLSFFIPIIALVYAIIHRDELQLALWLQVVGMIITIGGTIYLRSQGM